MRTGSGGGVGPTLDRRALLASLAAGTAATGGCVQRIRRVLGRRRPDPVAFDVKTVPADEDPFALLVARRLAGWFRAAGLDARVLPMAGEELLRQVLVNHEFDAFVTRYPHIDVDPDALYSLLHSTYSAEPGWQNPFGYADLQMDELLETQRGTSGATRRSAVADLQHAIVRENPFTVLAFPDAIRTVRRDRFTGWSVADLSAPTGYLELEAVDDATELRVTTTDPRVTENLNPLSAEFRRRGLVTGLVYDPLVCHHGGEYLPWLAASWEWRGDDGSTVVVRLRENLQWHDGEALTAADVAFTYRLLADSSLGRSEEPVPATRFRGRSSLVSSVGVRDETTLFVQFDDCSPEVAVRALTVPILPRHVWQERTREATVGGIDIGGPTTEAIVTDNVPPVGSGPLAFVEADARERLVLERYRGHFLAREVDPGLPDSIDDGPAFDRFVIRVAGSDPSAVELVATGAADATVTPVGPDVVPRIGRNDDLDLQVRRSSSFYFVGFNTRRAPFANPRFRGILAQLCDREFLAEEVFDGYAVPALSPLAGIEWVPPDLYWSEAKSVAPFFGEDGTVDVERAREAFREAGYRYDEEGRLLEG